MKHKLLILFAFMPLFVYAQVQKVAILETVDKEGNISYAHKLMLRSNLAKAITNAPGYEAYDRTDMDAIMGEQNFQRTGLVSEDQIKRLGAMTGAAFILVAEAVKVDEQTMFITAKILNVESAKTEATDNVLMAATPSDIQHGCESLANKLLGLGSATVNPSPKQKQKAAEAPKPQANPIVVNVVASNALSSDAELKTFEDGTKGIVFYKSEDGHGLAVSLFATKAKWHNVRRTRECYDISTMPNENGIKFLTYRQGEQYTALLIQALGAGLASAAAWCAQQGNGWYLPSGGELWYLLSVANEQQCENGRISIAIQQAGGSPLTSDEWYWSSSENDNDEAVNVTCSGKIIASEDKNSELNVRAIRAF